MIRKFLERCVIASLAFRGKLDHLPKNLKFARLDLDEAKRIEEALRAIIEKTQQERDYWYQLWFRMGSEFQAGQSALMDEIERLQRKLGGKENPKLREVMDKMNAETKADFVAPEKHPSPAVKTPLSTVDCPPKPAKPPRTRTKK